MQIKVNSETIIFKSKIKCKVKTLKSKNREFNVCRIKNIFELSERKVSKSPCQFIKPTC